MKELFLIGRDCWLRFRSAVRAAAVSGDFFICQTDVQASKDGFIQSDDAPAVLASTKQFIAAPNRFPKFHSASLSTILAQNWRTQLQGVIA